MTAQGDGHVTTRGDGHVTSQRDGHVTIKEMACDHSEGRPCDRVRDGHVTTRGACIYVLRGTSLPAPAHQRQYVSVGEAVLVADQAREHGCFTQHPGSFGYRGRGAGTPCRDQAHLAEDTAPLPPGSPMILAAVDAPMMMERLGAMKDMRDSTYS